MKFEDTYDWIFDGQFLRLTSKPAGDFAGTVSIMGVDPVTGQFTTWGFHADGFVSRGSSRLLKEGVWVGPWNAVGPKGSIKSRSRLTKVDDDTVRLKVLERTIEGDIPEYPEVTTWRRNR
jgi:hypothetical protein